MSDVMDFPPRPKNGISLCAGGGGLDMGLHLAEPGFSTRLYVEYEPYPQSVLIAAQRAGYFAPAPIWDDIKTFDAKPFAGMLDTVIAGYPCQPFSMAGKRKGEDDERHLWPHVARIIRELGPTVRWIFLENVAGHVTLGAEAVLRDLYDLDATPAAGVFSAEEVGAPHERQRWFCVAYREGRGLGIVGDAAQQGRGRHADGGDKQLADANANADQRRLGGGGIAGRAGKGESEGEERKRIWPWHWGRSDELADADGGNPGPERQQHGGQQRFQPEGGSDGGRSLDDATSPRCDATRIGPEADSQGGQCLSGDRCDEVAQPTSAGSSQRRQPGQPASGAQSGNGMVAEPERFGGNGQMADAISSAGHEGSASGRSGCFGPHGKASTGAFGRVPYLFPPGPSDRDAWAAVIAAAPNLAPSASVRDLFSRARSLEADGREWWKATAEPEFCRMVAGMANRTLPLKLLGNGVVPVQAAYAWQTLSAAHGLQPMAIGDER